MKKLLIILLLCAGCQYTADDAKEQVFDSAIQNIKVSTYMGRTYCKVDFLYPSNIKELEAKGFKVRKVDLEYIITWQD